MYVKIHCLYLKFGGALAIVYLIFNSRYTFGERVDGTVRVNATLTSSSRRESIPFYDTTVPLVSLSPEYLDFDRFAHVFTVIMYVSASVGSSVKTHLVIHIRLFFSPEELPLVHVDKTFTVTYTFF